MFPRIIAALLVAASTSYLVDVLLQFLAPAVADVVNPALVGLFILAEVSRLVFLLVKGVQNRVPADRALVDA